MARSLQHVVGLFPSLQEFCQLRRRKVGMFPSPSLQSGESIAELLSERPINHRGDVENRRHHRKQPLKFDPQLVGVQVVAFRFDEPCVVAQPQQSGDSKARHNKHRRRTEKVGEDIDRRGS